MILCLLDSFTLSVLLNAKPEMWPPVTQLKKTRNYRALPIKAKRLASAQPVPKPPTRQFYEPFHDAVSCGDGRYLSFRSDGESHPEYWEFKAFLHVQPWKAGIWISVPEGIGAAGTISVRLWSTKSGRTAFCDVPELLDPQIFDRGRLPWIRET